MHPLERLADMVEKARARGIDPNSLPGFQELVVAVQATLTGNAAEAFAEGLRSFVSVQVKDVIRQRTSLLMKRGIEASVGAAIERVGGTFTMAFRVYGERFEKDSVIPIQYWRDFAFAMYDLLESHLLEKIRGNIKQSFIEGGRLRGDIEGSGRWKPLSKKYVEKVKGGDRRFGILTGGMFRNLYRGAIIVHFDPKTLGAREFSIDFGRGEVGRKLALFYHGRSKGVGKQPPRPFTFLTRQDFRKLTNLVKKHFDVAIEDTRRFFIGLAFGPMPTYLQFKEKAIYPRVPMRRITARSGRG